MPQLGHDPAIIASTWTRSGKLSMPQLGHDPQPVYQNKERLLSRSKQYGVFIKTTLF